MPLTADDEDLAVRLECDPEMMRSIGGPRPEADVRAAHKRGIALIEKGEAHMYTIVADDTGFQRIASREIAWFLCPVGSPYAAACCGTQPSIYSAKLPSQCSPA